MLVVPPNVVVVGMSVVVVGLGGVSGGKDGELCESSKESTCTQHVLRMWR